MMHLALESHRDTRRTFIGQCVFGHNQCVLTRVCQHLRGFMDWYFLQNRSNEMQWKTFSV